MFLYKRSSLHVQGRGGKGSIFVWATGNGGSVGDDCSCDGYVSSIYTLSVGCISDHGLSTYFSEVCPSTIAVVFTGGSHKQPGDAEYKAPKIKVVCGILHCVPKNWMPAMLSNNSNYRGSVLANFGTKTHYFIAHVTLWKILELSTI